MFNFVIKNGETKRVIDNKDNKLTFTGFFSPKLESVYDTDYTFMIIHPINDNETVEEWAPDILLPIFQEFSQFETVDLDVYYNSNLIFNYKNLIMTYRITNSNPDSTRIIDSNNRPSERLEFLIDRTYNID